MGPCTHSLQVPQYLPAVFTWQGTQRFPCKICIVAETARHANAVDLSTNTQLEVASKAGLHLQTSLNCMLLCSLRMAASFCWLCKT